MNVPRFLRLPVFSNIGESLAIPPTSTSRRVMVVFGLPGTRKKSHCQLSAVGTTLHDLEIEEILDIGPDCGAPSTHGRIPVKRMGVLTAAEIGDILTESRFGFVPHPAITLAKSGIFAAFSALGTIPVIGKPFFGEVDGLKDGIQMLSPGTVLLHRESGLQPISTAAWHWYSGHRLHVHAATYAQILFAIPVETALDIPTNARLLEESNGPHGVK